MGKIGDFERAWTKQPRKQLKEQEALESQLAALVEEQSLAVVLHILSNVCGNNALASEKAGDLKLMDAWILAKDRVYRAYREQIQRPGY